MPTAKPSKWPEILETHQNRKFVTCETIQDYQRKKSKKARILHFKASVGHSSYYDHKQSRLECN